MSENQTTDFRALRVPPNQRGEVERSVVSFGIPIIALLFILGQIFEVGLLFRLLLVVYATVLFTLSLQELLYTVSNRRRARSAGIRTEEK